jgi:hypothetical protein
LSALPRQRRLSVQVYGILRDIGLEKLTTGYFIEARIRMINDAALRCFADNLN